MSDEAIDELNSNSEWGTFTLIGIVALILDCHSRVFDLLNT